MALTVGSFSDRNRRDLMALGFYGDLAGDDFGMWLLPDVASRRSAPAEPGPPPRSSHPSDRGTKLDCPSSRSAWPPEISIAMGWTIW